MKILLSRLSFIIIAVTASVSLSFAVDPPVKKNGEESDVPAKLKTTSSISVRQFPEFDDDLNITTRDPLFAEDFQAPLSDTLGVYHQRALDLEEYLIENNRFVEILDDKTLIDLPIGIRRNIGGLTYTISIDSIVMTPQDAYLIAYMVFEVPSSGKKITFRGGNIKLSKTGGITGDARIELIGDQSMNLFGENSVLTLRGDGTTFAEFDCNGFKRMGVGADIIFSRDMFVPENPDGTTRSERVTASFTTTLSNWNDLITVVDIPDFQVKGLEGVGFSIQNAVFDFSDYRNAPAVKFPAGYDANLPAEAMELWRGFYASEVSISMPPQFNAKGETTRKKFAANDVLIDRLGFTGTLVATKLLLPKEGDMNGWSFSLDSLYISMEANRLKSGGFSGDIVIPISGEATPFEYSAVINTGNEYIFNVSPAEDLEFEVFKASQVEIYEASYLEVRLVDGKFKPKANLHGKMSINAKMGESSSSKSASLADISFENLELQTEKPYLKVGAFSFGSEAAQQAMAGFPVSINNIGFKSVSDTEVSLDFDLVVNLNESFGGEAGLSIIGNMREDGGWQSWRYKKLQVNDIMIDIDQGAFKFYGKLTFFRNDQVYGDGFNGIVDAEFKPGVKVKATAIFGSVSDMRYWYADAMAEFNNGIPIFTGVAIYGFGGGAYYRMKMDSEGVGSDFGKTNSGVVYVPDAESGLGLKASVAIGSHPTKTAFNGDATFEISFFRGGGVRYIAFSGNAFLLTPPVDGGLAKLQEKVGKVADAASKLESGAVGMLSGAVGGGTDNSVKQIYGDIGASAGKRGQLSAHMLVSYDFENNVLHGNFEMYVNVAGGIIKGVGPGGRAGWSVLHFAPDEWYIYVGTPDDRIGISAGIGPIRASMTSYLMVGTKILGSPPPPQEVSDILGGMDLDYMRDLNALGTGAGFAFGAAFSVDTGDLSFLLFYARFQAGAGFDIMIKDYGSAECKGRSGPIGINGWYANGQAYAYFEGKVGIRVKIFGKRKSVEILSIGAAAVLQAKLPNPFWMRGVVGGRFSVLGGLVKGNCKFQVTLGKECEIVGGSVLEGLQVIADVTPVTGTKDVNVFTTPQVVFNMAVGHEFEMVDTDDKKKKFRIKLDELKLIHDGYEIPGTIDWNDAKDVAAFNAHDVFPSEKDIKLTVQVSFEEYTGGSWTPVIVSGQKYIEKKESTFKSGVAPDYIPHENVEYSYPVVSQLNFYKDEYNKGYIKLKRGQPYLFEVDQEWVQKGRFKSSAGTSQINFNYSSSAKQVNFNLPNNLSNNKLYQFELVNLPVKQAGAIDRNVTSQNNKVDLGNENLNTEMRTRKAEGTIEELQEKAIYTSHFKTSQYATFSQKVNSHQIFATYRGLLIPWSIHFLKTYVTTSEYYDESELHGSAATGNMPLVTVEADLVDNTYYQNRIYPLVYADYPIDGDIRITSRDVDEMGLPPVHAVYIRQTDEHRRLTDSDITSGYVTTVSNGMDFRYKLAYYMANDFWDIQNKIVARYINDAYFTPRVESIIWGQYPVIQPGSYKVKLKYTLPGQTSPNSVKNWTLIYE